MKSRLYIFSSSYIGYDILQKCRLSTQVVKFCFNKNSFHIQFYVMRTFQNLLAHVNCVADVEKMDSDGKTHASLCMHVCVQVFSIRDVTISLFISSLFLNQDSSLGVQLVSTPDLTNSDSRHKASSDCRILYKTPLRNNDLT